MTVYPEFQPQNPALSGYSLGWLSCTSFSAAMAASYHRQVKKAMTGGSVRNLCRNPDGSPDRSGGTNLAQNDGALNRGWGIDLAVHYRLPWATFEKLIDRGMGAVLQGWYAPIADSRWDAGRGFRGNHAVFVPPSWGVMDPLADGRASGVYKYAGEPYPRALLRSFAGKLNLASSGYRPLGDGYVYAMVTADRVNTYRLRFDGSPFWVYELGADARIRSRHTYDFNGPTSARCGIPKRYDWPGHGGRTLVRMLDGALVGQYVGVPQSAVEIEVVP